MNERVIRWTDEGKANAVANGVSFAEVIQALDAIVGENRLELLWVVFGLAESGRTVRVVLIRDEDSFVWRIIGARVVG